MAVGISSGGGTGASAIETSYIQLYNDGFQQQFQQMDTRFAKYFDVVSQDSEFQYYERMGVGDELISDNVRYADNPVSEISVDRRQIGLDDYHQGKYVEMKDLIRLASDPTNAYVTALTAAAHRKMDKIVLDAIFGTAKTGKSGGTSVAFVGTNSDQITVGALSAGVSRPITTAGNYTLQAGDAEGIDIAVDFVAGGAASNSGITLDKLKAARFTMERLEAVDADETLDCWITSSQAEQLLGIDEVINSDFATRKALAEGQATTFMNFRFLRSELLKGAGTAGDPRQVIVAKQDALKVAYGKDLGIEMWRDGSKRNQPYMYLSLSMGATRMSGEVTCKINCLD